MFILTWSKSAWRNNTHTYSFTNYRVHNHIYISFIVWYFTCSNMAAASSQDPSKRTPLFALHWYKAFSTAISILLFNLIIEVLAFISDNDFATFKLSEKYYHFSLWWSKVKIISRYLNQWLNHIYLHLSNFKKLLLALLLLLFIAFFCYLKFLVNYNFGDKNEFNLNNYLKIFYYLPSWLSHEK